MKTIARGMSLVAGFCAACLIAMWSLLPVEAQGFGRQIGGNVRDAFGDQGFHRRRRVRPTLEIARDRQAGAVSLVSVDHEAGLLFVVLGDGTARLWDLGRGVQVGRAIPGGIVAGTVRGRGAGAAEAVMVRQDGSWLALPSYGGPPRPLGDRIPDFDPRTPPVLSEDGRTMAFLTTDGRWHVGKVDGEQIALSNAAPSARPMLSGDGSMIAFRVITEGGRTATALARLAVGEGGLQPVGWLTRKSVFGGKQRPVDGCVRRAKATAGVFTPDGSMLVLGDDRGNVCAWSLAGEGPLPRFLFIEKKALARGSVEVLAVDAKGSQVAARGAGRGGRAVGVWSVDGGRAEKIASLELGGSPSALALDSERRWLLTGGGAGTVYIHAFERRGKKQWARPRPVGRLISTDDGWAVIDRRGRFDGVQNGIEAVAWADSKGRKDEKLRDHTLPADAFSDTHFEPRLLAKLYDSSQALLKEDAPDLLAEEGGFVPPPAVTIAGVDVTGRTAEVEVKLDEDDYPSELNPGIRLYHNGKLVPHRQAGSSQARLEAAAPKENDTIRYRVELLPGENRFQAIGVGPSVIVDKTEGRFRIDGRPDEETTVIPFDETTSPPDLHVVAIGISKYDSFDGWIPDLTYSRNDAETIARELSVRATDLRSPGGDSLYGQVRVSPLLLDSGATKEAIVDRIGGLSLSPKDVLFVYFGGHGIGWEKDGRQVWYLVPYAGNATHVEEIGLSKEELLALLTKKVRARRVFLVLDACYSGAVVASLNDVAQQDLRGLARTGGIHVLAATRADEEAAELRTEEGEHGALTHLVLEALRGEADGRGRGQAMDQRISVREIVTYAAEEMPMLAERLALQRGLAKATRFMQQPTDYSRDPDFPIAAINQGKNREVESARLSDGA